MATPITSSRPGAYRDPASGDDRRLRLDDILKLMAADGLVPRAEAERLARTRTRQYDHPLGLVAAQHWKSAKAPHPAMTLEWLVEWLAAKLGVRCMHPTFLSANVPVVPLTRVTSSPVMTPSSPAPLIVASVLALALIIERGLALRRARILPSGLLDDVVGVVRKQSASPDVLAKLEQNSPLRLVLAAGLRKERVLREGAIQQIEAAGAVVANRLTKNLTLLGSIGSIAPLLGLFGTVVGMIHIFASQQAGSSPQELARGISVALYCTAFGIIVAVPAVLAHRYFRRLVEDYLVDMEEQAERLLEVVYGNRRA